MISTAPNWGIRSSVGMLYKSIRLLSLLFFLKDLHFIFSSIPVILPVSVSAVIESYKPSSPTLNFDFLLKNHALGIPNTAIIFQNWAKKSPICCLFYILRTLIKISFLTSHKRTWNIWIVTKSSYEYMNRVSFLQTNIWIGLYFDICRICE